MKKRTIALCSTLLLSSGLPLLAQNQERGPRGQGQGRERPDMFALADKDKSGGVSLDELVTSRVEMMSRRGPRGGGGGEGGPQRGQGGGQRGGPGGNPEEMKAMMKERMAGMFKEADKDENGELSREEFGQVMQGQRGGRGGPGGRGPGGPRPRGDA